VAYITRFYARLDSMSRMASATERAAASARRVFAILDREPKVAEPRDPIHPGRLKGAIELRNVSFRYGARRVLRNIDLAIEPGEMVGLVGQSGAGKTTVINLLCRFYDVTDGAILVDGVDVRRFPVNEFRRNIGLVLQEPFLFYGTVAENIAYGRPDATRQEIIAAARAARAHEFILRLPNGYDSLVGERGQFVSGGERQRLSIARALLIDPRILILDEATSSVDSETEHEIQLALENLTRGRTTIAIAHRLSTLQKADRLVVLEQGEIIEIGSHAELLAKAGAYSRFYRMQRDTSRQLAEPSEAEGESE
jgi:ATP-binding cassette subfamily B protein